MNILRKKVQIWWFKNDTAAYRKSENDSCIYDRKKNILRKKVQIWWFKNDTAAYRKSENDSCIYDRKRTFCVKKCRFGGSKTTQQHIGNLKMTLASMTEKEHFT
jgi:hypothetical protein